MDRGEAYWAMIEPFWDVVNIYDGPDVFLESLARVPKANGLLYAAHFCQSEVCNGGFEQFFGNSTGVLGPEAIKGFEQIGLPRMAELVRRACGVLSATYPRDREKRQAKLELVNPRTLGKLDEQFYKLWDTENGGFVTAADRYALSFKRDKKN